MTWESVIGLEVHVQLATASKIFSGAGTTFGAEPNRQTCALDLALPGTLPVLNGEAVRMAAMFGLAIGAEVASRSMFDRKNYFYPDLPKGYQVSQLHHPIVGPGSLNIPLTDGDEKTVRITRAHLEEDAGKSIHDRFEALTAVDLNRAGTPLLEIVTEPDLRAAAEAVACLRAIHSLVRYLGICDGDMSQGSLRCDVNVSVRPAGDEALGVRAEIKNLNSFRFVERAIVREVERQIAALEGGGEVVQETRLYDAEADETRPMRGKEYAEDYRYFPEPDLLPVELDAACLTAIREAMPELPGAVRARFIAEYGLADADATLLAADINTAKYFESCVADCNEPRLTGNWMLGELAAALNREALDIGDCPVGPAALAELIARIQDQTISGRGAKEAFAALWAGEGELDRIIEARNLRQLSDTGELEALVDQVLAEHPKQVAEFAAGKTKVLAFFVGQVMKLSRGKANPGEVNRLLGDKLRR